VDICISIIIVNYNTASIISDCLDSVFQQKGVNFEVIVVDNASQDNSVAILKQYPRPLLLLTNQENKGFGHANNQAFTLSQGRYLFLLNPDARLNTPNDLANMVYFMDNNLAYGLIGPSVIKNNQETKPQFTYPGQKYLHPDIFKALPGSIAWVIGAAMLIRHNAYEVIRGFDEDYFLYGEEADLCLRIRQRGFQIGHIPEISVNHIGGASEKNTETRALWQKKQKGLHLFYQKHYETADVKKIISHEWFHAQRVLLLLRLKKLIGLFNKKDNVKWKRYSVIVESSKTFLEQIM
jgi:hypothetical protein